MSQNQENKVTDNPVSYASGLRSYKDIFAREKDPLNSRTDRFQPGKFPVGFYIYRNEGIRDEIKKMHDMGFNSVHIVEPSQNHADWQQTFDYCRELGVSLLLQLNSVYLFPQSTVVDLVPRAVSLINNYQDRPEILAFSVREEPPASIMPKLQEYYQGIYAANPNAPLYLLHSHISTVSAAKPPYPLMNGTDRYNFWWEFGTGSNRATPISALTWYHTQMNGYYQNSLKQNGEFFAVFTPLPASHLISKQRVHDSFYPKDMPEGTRAKLVAMVDRYVEEKNQGWWADEANKDAYWHWKYYSAPKNTVRALCWLSVMEGAKSVYCYHWIPEETWAGQNGTYIERRMNDVQLKEYSDFAKDIQRYGKLVRAMMKEFVPYSGDPLGHEEVEMAKLEETPIEFGGENVVHRSFRINGYEGKVVVAVNTKVGDWCEGESPYHLKPQHLFRVDDSGELMDYQPAEGERPLEFAVTKGNMVCIDLKTGAEVKLKDGKIGEIAALPGEGRVLFVYPRGSDEGKRLIKEFGIN